jgi:uncharacterized protein (TIGR03905 family)
MEPDGSKGESGMTYTRRNVGVCSTRTTVDLAEDGTIEAISIEDGCDGNLSGYCALLPGMQAQAVIERLKNVTCEDRDTSCPQQIAFCLKEALAQLSQE